MISLISVLIICLTAFFSQLLYYAYKRSEREHVDTIQLAEHLEKKLLEIADYKQKVDSLVLKSGFTR